MAFQLISLDLFYNSAFLLTSFVENIETISSTSKSDPCITQYKSKH